MTAPETPPGCEAEADRLRKLGAARRAEGRRRMSERLLQVLADMSRLEAQVASAQRLAWELMEEEAS